MTISPTPPSPKDWSFQSREELGSLAGSKPARPDVIIESASSLPIEIMTDLLFEDIGGEEILSMTRSDIVGGAKQEYQQISNLGKVASQYNSLNIIPIQGTAIEIFNDYPISLFEFLPDGEHIVVINDQQEVSVQLSENIGRSYQVEIEVLPSDEIFDDTIYTEES